MMTLVIMTGTDRYEQLTDHSHFPKIMMIHSPLILHVYTRVWLTSHVFFSYVLLWCLSWTPSHGYSHLESEHVSNYSCLFSMRLKHNLIWLHFSYSPSSCCPSLLVLTTDSYLQRLMLSCLLNSHSFLYWPHNQMLSCVSVFLFPFCLSFPVICLFMIRRHVNYAFFYAINGWTNRI